MSLATAIPNAYGMLKYAKRRRWLLENPAEDAERVRLRRRTEFAILNPADVLATARCAVSAGGRGVDHGRGLHGPQTGRAAFAPLARRRLHESAGACAPFRVAGDGGHAEV